MSEKEKMVLAFLREWLAWAEAGGHDYSNFSRGDALCDAFLWWTGSMMELPDDLFSEFQDVAYPFGGKDVYNHELDNDTMHLNPLRLAWVRETIAKLENENGQ